VRRSRSPGRPSGRLAPILEAGAPPVIDQLAKSTGTDATGNMTEIPGVSAFVLGEGTVYHTYATTAAAARS
jgi:hypothetical protein